MTKLRSTLFYRILSGFVAFSFFFSLVLPPGYAQLIPQTLLNLPAPGAMVSVSPAFTPALINGITIHPENPLQFDFIVSTGDPKLTGQELTKEANKLIKYFLAALTVPEKEMWVNLSPHEKDRIIPPGFGNTEMGRDLLAQDYILKQLTASLMYPEKELGKKFWDKIYKQAREKYGTTEIPMDTFNKVWIVPEDAVIYEQDNSAFVVKSQLKVMLEEDYQSMNQGQGARGQGPGKELDQGSRTLNPEIIREIILPAIEKEVNTGETFANLRQIYNSTILAAWYKMTLKESLLGQVYVDQNKTKGIDTQDKQVNEKIYNQYLEAFKKGVYNYIKEDYDEAAQEVIPRKYFSGGANLTLTEATNVNAKPALSRFRRWVNGALAIIALGGSLAAGGISPAGAEAMIASGLKDSSYVRVVTDLKEFSPKADQDYYAKLSGQISSGAVFKPSTSVPSEETKEYVKQPAETITSSPVVVTKQDVRTWGGFGDLKIDETIKITVKPSGKDLKKRVPVAEVGHIKQTVPSSSWYRLKQELTNDVYIVELKSGTGKNNLLFNIGSDTDGLSWVSVFRSNDGENYEFVSKNDNKSQAINVTEAMKTLTFRVFEGEKRIEVVVSKRWFDLLTAIKGRKLIADAGLETLNGYRFDFKLASSPVGGEIKELSLSSTHEEIIAVRDLVRAAVMAQKFDGDPEAVALAGTLKYEGRGMRFEDGFFVSFNREPVLKYQAPLAGSSQSAEIFEVNGKPPVHFTADTIYLEIPGDGGRLLKLAKNDKADSDKGFQASYMSREEFEMARAFSIPRDLENVGQLAGEINQLARGRGVKGDVVQEKDGSLSIVDSQGFSNRSVSRTLAFHLGIWKKDSKSQVVQKAAADLLGKMGIEASGVKAQGEQGGIVPSPVVVGELWQKLKNRVWGKSASEKEKELAAKLADGMREAYINNFDGLIEQAQQKAREGMRSRDGESFWGDGLEEGFQVYFDLPTKTILIRGEKVLGRQFVITQDPNWARGESYQGRKLIGNGINVLFIGYDRARKSLYVVIQDDAGYRNEVSHSAGGAFHAISESEFISRRANGEIPNDLEEIVNLFPLRDQILQEIASSPVSELNFKLAVNKHIELGKDPAGTAWGEVIIDVNDPSYAQNLSKLLELAGLPFRDGKEGAKIIITVDSSGGASIPAMVLDRRRIIQFVSEAVSYGDYGTLLMLNGDFSFRFFEMDQVVLLPDVKALAVEPQDKESSNLVIHFYDKDTEGGRALRSSSPVDIEKEIAGGKKVGDALHTVLSPASLFAGDFLKGGYRQPGYGVEAGAVIDGSHAVGEEGNQGYYVNRTNVPDGKGGFKSGKQVFVDTVNDMKTFFARRAEFNKPVRVVIKTGIGGQHTPFQGMASVFEKLDSGENRILGEYELGKDFESYLTKIVREMNIDWDQIGLIPSSKSGSTDETMIVFTQIIPVLLGHVMQTHVSENAAQDVFTIDQGKFGQAFLDYLHTINFKNGKELPAGDLFENFNLDDLVSRIHRDGGSNALIPPEWIKQVLGKVLGNMFFETTDRPAASRLSAFIRNSGLDRILGKDAPGFGAMFDNVGGRWTGDLHMMTFLSFYNLDPQAYWQVRYEGIRQVRASTHQGNKIGNKILNEDIKKIALVVPDEYFWFGKSIEQNFNESIWQEGFANLRAIKQSTWEKQKRYYGSASQAIVLNLADLAIEDTFNVVNIDPVRAHSKQELAQEFGRLLTTFYGMTYTVGTRLIARALFEEGDYRGAGIDVNDLNNEATKILQENLFLRQPFVELGKNLLEKRLTDLQAAQQAWINGERQGISPVEEAVKAMIDAAQGKEIRALNPFLNVGELPELVKRAAFDARQTGKTFVPFVYLAGEEFVHLRDYLQNLGIEWVLQGSGDQHISWQQVLAQPHNYLPFIISFVPEANQMTPGLPAVGFAKGYLDNISPHVVRDYFAEASYQALVDQGGEGIFMRILDTEETREEIEAAFEAAFASSPVTVFDDALEASYTSKVADEYVKPVVLIDTGGNPIGTVKKGDVWISLNFRRDRTTQLTEALLAGENFKPFPVENLDLMVVEMKEDENGLIPPGQLVLAPVYVPQTVGEYFSQIGLKQFRTAETEKFRHVTRFFNGAYSTKPFAGEDRLLVPSPRDVVTYDQKPEMSAYQVTAGLIERLQANEHDFYLLNYANPDMVGHTGNLEATVQAVGHVDKNLQQLLRIAQNQGLNILITADHGNADEMLDKEGKPQTKHSLNPVPLVFVLSRNARLTGTPALLPGGGLADVAPTLLHTMGLEQPTGMTGRNLLEGYTFDKGQKTLLIVLDGFAINPNRKDPGDAIRLAGERGLTPTLDKLFRENLNTLLDASGEAVGLPKGQMGSSETGHMIMGAGRVIKDQPLVKINEMIAKGRHDQESFFKNPALLKAMHYARDNRKALHIEGLLSDGGVHSMNTHWYALLEMAEAEGVREVYLHPVLDGRDVGPQTAQRYLEELQGKIDEIGSGHIVTMMGRFYAMDRDYKWERTKIAYDAYVYGQGERVEAASPLGERDLEEIKRLFREQILAWHAEDRREGKSLETFSWEGLKTYLTMDSEAAAMRKRFSKLEEIFEEKQNRWPTNQELEDLLSALSKEEGEEGEAARLFLVSAVMNDFIDDVSVKFIKRLFKGPVSSPAEAELSRFDKQYDRASDLIRTTPGTFQDFDDARTFNMLLQGVDLEDQVDFANALEDFKRMYNFYAEHLEHNEGGVTTVYLQQTAVPSFRSNIKVFDHLLDKYSAKEDFVKRLTLLREQLNILLLNAYSLHEAIFRSPSGDNFETAMSEKYSLRFWYSEEINSKGEIGYNNFNLRDAEKKVSWEHTDVYLREPLPGDMGVSQTLYTIVDRVEEALDRRDPSIQGMRPEDSVAIIKEEVQKAVDSLKKGFASSLIDEQGQGSRVPPTSLGTPIGRKEQGAEIDGIRDTSDEDVYPEQGPTDGGPRRGASSPAGVSEDADDIKRMVDHSQAPGSPAAELLKLEPDYSRGVEKISTDQEIISDNRVPVSSPAGVHGPEEEVVGGIDLNPALLDLQIKRDGNGVPLPLPQQPIEHMHIEGFLPIIINITPVTNLPMLLGLADAAAETQAITATPDWKAREVEPVSLLN